LSFCRQFIVFQNNIKIGVIFTLHAVLDLPRVEKVFVKDFLTTLCAQKWIRVCVLVLPGLIVSIRFLRREAAIYDSNPAPSGLSFVCLNALERHCPKAPTFISRQSTFDPFRLLQKQKKLLVFGGTD